MTNAVRMLGLLTAALGLAACATSARRFRRRSPPPTPRPSGAASRRHVVGDGASISSRSASPKIWRPTWPGSRPTALLPPRGVSPRPPRASPTTSTPTTRSRCTRWSRASVGPGRAPVLCPDRVRIDGARMSLYAFENEVIRPLGEPRVHFALNCMVRGCPRLPRGPFTAERLDTSSTRRRGGSSTTRAMSRSIRRSGRCGSTHPGVLHRGLPGRAPSLPAYVNRYRSAPIPVDYRVRFIPYDWTLHQR